MTNERQDVALRFRSAAGTITNGVGFELYQNQPNPFVGNTFIGFHLPAASSATLSWTLGEVITSTENSSTAILTQGFQQPIIIIPSSTANLENRATGIVVFPNPTARQITIQKEQSEPLKAELINVLGQVIGFYNLSDNSTLIDLQQLPAANYLLRIRSLNNEAIQTFKIQKIY